MRQHVILPNAPKGMCVLDIWKPKIIPLSDIKRSPNLGFIAGQKKLLGSIEHSSGRHFYSSLNYGGGGQLEFEKTALVKKEITQKQ